MRPPKVKFKTFRNSQTLCATLSEILRNASPVFHVGQQTRGAMDYFDSHVILFVFSRIARMDWNDTFDPQMTTGSMYYSIIRTTE